MRSPSSAHTVVSGVAFVTAVAAAWFFLAPGVLGGSTSYVSTEGVSMLPHFRTGDLVLVRARSSYHVGEIVAYHSRMLHTVVLHRIVGRDGEKYLFKGDNNGWIDPEHPGRSQLIGTLWVHLPGVAGRLASIRSPVSIGGLVGFGVLLLGGGAVAQKRRRRRRSPDQPPRRPEPTEVWVMNLLTVGALVLAPFTALAILAYSRPALAPAPVNVPYSQRGTLSYSAPTVPGPVYPTGQATTGEPLYLALAHSLSLRYAYRFSAAAAHSVSGVGSLDARVTSSTGWIRTLPIQAPRRFSGDRVTPRRFSGDRVTLAGVLDLRTLTALIRKVDAASGVPAAYTLDLVPHVRAEGAVGGFPLQATFGSPLSFALNDREVQPSADAAKPVPGTGETHGMRPQPASISFKVARLDVAKARTIASRGLATAICALLGCGLALRRGGTRRVGAAAAVGSRYRRWIVPVARVLQPAPGQLVEISDMAALARIAERYDRMILHETNEGSDTFSVADDGVLYRYAVVTEAAPSVDEPGAEPAPVALAAVPPLKRSA